MKKIIFVIISLLLFNTTFSQYDSIKQGNIFRTYLLHLPSSYNSSNSYSLIIAMHGGFGNAFNLENQSKLSIKADAANFIVVYPEGVKSPLNIRTWNAGWCCGYSSTTNVNDVGFISNLIDSLKLQYNIDLNRVYATGMSNGGFMSYRLACELSNKIAAIAPVAASMSMTSCNPTRPVPIIHFHSYLDSSVVYSGGIGNGTSNHYNCPQDSVMNAWAQKDSCTILNDTVIHNSQYTLTKWKNCKCNYEIHHYITTDGGHSWPGGAATVIGDPPSTYINANDLMWTFFQQHSLLCPNSSGINEAKENSIQLFPNPVNEILTINSNNINQVVITDVAGKIVLEKNCSSLNTITVDVSLLNSGMYFIRIINSDKKHAIGKIIVD